MENQSKDVLTDSVEEFILEETLQNLLEYDHHQVGDKWQTSTGHWYYKVSDNPSVIKSFSPEEMLQNASNPEVRAKMKQMGINLAWLGKAVNGEIGQEPEGVPPVFQSPQLRPIDRREVKTPVDLQKAITRNSETGELDYQGPTGVRSTELKHRRGPQPGEQKEVKKYRAKNSQGDVEAESLKVVRDNNPSSPTYGKVLDYNGTMFETDPETGELKYSPEASKYLSIIANEKLEDELTRLSPPQQEKVEVKTKSASQQLDIYVHTDKSPETEKVRSFFPDINSFITSTIGVVYSKAEEWNTELQKARGLSHHEAAKVAHGLAIADYGVGTSIGVYKVANSGNAPQGWGKLGYYSAAIVPWATLSYIAAAPLMVSATQSGSFTDKLKAGLMSPYWVAKSALKTVASTLDKLGIHSVVSAPNLTAQSHRAYSVTKGQTPPEYTDLGLTNQPDNKAGKIIGGYRQIGKRGRPPGHSAKFTDPNSSESEEIRIKIGKSKEEWNKMTPKERANASAAHSRSINQKQRRKFEKKQKQNQSYSFEAVTYLEDVSLQLLVEELGEEGEEDLSSLTGQLQGQQEEGEGEQAYSNLSKADVDSLIEFMDFVGYNDWYMCLVLTAYGSTGDMQLALRVAFDAYYEEPDPPEEEDETEETVESLKELVAEIDLDQLAFNIMEGIEDHVAGVVYRQLKPDYPRESIDWVKKEKWEGPIKVPLDEIDFSNQMNWRATHEPEKVKKFEGYIGEDIIKPVIMAKTPTKGKYVVLDGHHRTLAYKNLKKPVIAYVAHVEKDKGPWDEMHSSQRIGDSYTDNDEKIKPSEVKEDKSEEEEWEHHRKEYDIIDLPKTVEGTNCGNCMYFKNDYCEQSHIKHAVTARMCCVLWNRKDVKRNFSNKFSKVI